MGDLTRQCSWCKRVYRDGAWTYTDEPLAPGRTTHGMCEDCADRLYPGLTTETRLPAPTPTPPPDRR